ncbi:MAG: HlyD family secretion protein, partial [Acetobacteraceae bacterium]|nr:HlyD family secretion protein [Acetobacteraceae bacterium]
LWQSLEIPMSSTAALAREGAPRPVATATRRFRARRLAIAGALLATALGGGWYGYDWWTEGRFLETTDDAYVGGNVTSIAPHVGGFIQQIAVADNEHVAAGQLLVRLDPRDYQATLDHAAAVVAGRLAALESLRAQSVLQQSMIKQQAATLAAKSSHALFASEDAERYRSLALTAAGSRQNAERATTLEQEARSDVAAATAALEAARAQLKVLEAEIGEATAAAAQARADLETARLNLSYTEIRSPIDGYVGNRAAQQGAYVQAGAFLIAVIPSNGLWVDANFKEDQLTHMRPGERARVKADVLPGHTFEGRIESLAPGTGAVFSVIPPENATGNFTKIVQRVPVRIALNAGDPMLRLLRPGLSTLASTDTRTEASAAQ